MSKLFSTLIVLATIFALANSACYKMVNTECGSEDRNVFIGYVEGDVICELKDVPTGQTQLYHVCYHIGDVWCDDTPGVSVSFCNLNCCGQTIAPENQDACGHCHCGDKEDCIDVNYPVYAPQQVCQPELIPQYQIRTFPKWCQQQVEVNCTTDPTPTPNPVDPVPVCHEEQQEYQCGTDIIQVKCGEKVETYECGTEIVQKFKCFVYTSEPCPSGETVTFEVFDHYESSNPHPCTITEQYNCPGEYVLVPVCQHKTEIVCTAWDDEYKTSGFCDANCKNIDSIQDWTLKQTCQIHCSCTPTTVDFDCHDVQYPKQCYRTVESTCYDQVAVMVNKTYPKYCTIETPTYEDVEVTKYCNRTIDIFCPQTVPVYCNRTIEVCEPGNPDIPVGTCQVAADFKTVYLPQGYANPADYVNLLGVTPGPGYCQKLNIEFQGINNQATCGGGPNDIGFVYSTVFTVVQQTVIDFRFGLDFGLGGVITLNGVVVLAFSQDTWWNQDWNNGAVKYFSQNFLPGTYTLVVAGGEHCCDGPQAIHFKTGLGAWQPVSTVSLQNILCNGFNPDVPVTSTKKCYKMVNTICGEEARQVFTGYNDGPVVCHDKQVESGQYETKTVCYHYGDIWCVGTEVTVDFCKLNCCGVIVQAQYRDTCDQHCRCGNEEKCITQPFPVMTTQNVCEPEQVPVFETKVFPKNCQQQIEVECLWKEGYYVPQAVYAQNVGAQDWCNLNCYQGNEAFCLSFCELAPTTPAVVPVVKKYCPHAPFNPLDVNLQNWCKNNCSPTNLAVCQTICSEC